MRYQHEAEKIPVALSAEEVTRILDAEHGLGFDTGPRSACAMVAVCGPA